MKVVFLLFLSTFLMANLVCSSLLLSRLWHGTTLGNDPEIKCDNISYWKAVVEKVEKEHPSSDKLELTKYISQALMKDFKKPLLALTSFDVDDAKYENDTHVSTYGEFDGSLFDSITLFNNDINICDMGNNLSIAIILKKQASDNNSYRKWEHKFLKKLSNKKHLTHFMKKISKSSKGLNETFDCSKLPKIQAIIDKVEKMNITSTVEYTRMFDKEMEASVKPVTHFVTRMSLLDDESSFVMFGDGSSVDVDESCHPGAPDPRCLSCFQKQGFSSVFVSYFDK